MVNTLHVTGGLPAWLAALSRAAEPYRTERVAYVALAVLAWLGHARPEDTAAVADAVVWIAVGMAGRSALQAGAGAWSSRPMRPPSSVVVGQAGAVVTTPAADERPTTP